MLGTILGTTDEGRGMVKRKDKHSEILTKSLPFSKLIFSKSLKDYNA